MLGRIKLVNQRNTEAEMMTAPSRVSRRNRYTSDIDLAS